MKVEKLTRQELKVLQLYANHTTTQIARLLNVKLQTISDRLTQAQKKLECTSRIELRRMAQRMVEDALA